MKIGFVCFHLDIQDFQCSSCKKFAKPRKNTVILFFYIKGEKSKHLSTLDKFENFRGKFNSFLLFKQQNEFQVLFTLFCGAIQTDPIKLEMQYSKNWEFKKRIKRMQYSKKSNLDLRTKGKLEVFVNFFLTGYQILECDRISGQM